MKKMSRIFSAGAIVGLSLSAAAAVGHADPYYYDDCRAQRADNRAAGTVLGAIAGGVIGGAIGHGNGGAVVGGAILGGVAGNAIAGDMDCGDRRYAFRTYYDSLDGPIGARAQWRAPSGAYGYFTPIREYRQRGWVCRDFQETTYRRGREFVRQGSACRRRGGNWEFR